jgi:hypothetical protein
MPPGATAFQRTDRSVSRAQARVMSAAPYGHGSVWMDAQWRARRRVAAPAPRPSANASWTVLASASALPIRSALARMTARERSAACGLRRPATTSMPPNIAPAATLPQKPRASPKPYSAAKCARSCGTSCLRSKPGTRTVTPSSRTA